MLDGKLLPDSSAQVFEIVKRDACWQLAFERAHRREGRWPVPYKRRRNDSPAYEFEAFPHIVDDIVQGTRHISCNFNTRVPWDFADFLRREGEYSVVGRVYKWYDHQPKYLETVKTKPPLPKWEDLLPKGLSGKRRWSNE